MEINNGRRRRSVLSFVAAALILAAASARAASPVAGVVISIEGKPEIQRAGEKSFKPLKFNDMLREGDSVKTGRGSRVAVAFVGGAELRINEDSNFKMESG